MDGAAGVLGADCSVTGGAAAAAMANPSASAKTQEQGPGGGETRINYPRERWQRDAWYPNENNYARERDQWSADEASLTLREFLPRQRQIAHLVRRSAVPLGFPQRLRKRFHQQVLRMVSLAEANRELAA